MRFNRPVIGDKWDRLEAILGGAPDHQIAALNEEIGMPAGLAAMGVSRDQLPGIAAAALLDHCHATNPREASQADYQAILEEAF